jgi:tartrate-resistant acid phosphatase type 5
VRFVVSLGDNIYRGEGGFVDDEGGGEDDDWYSSFFQPYRYALARVPFFPAIGNHDTTDTEGADDRAQLEDNYHLRQRFIGDRDRKSSREPGLFYRVRHGRDLELVCLDTSHDNEDSGVNRYFQAPEHQAWLQETFAPGGARWLIPFSHHAMYCAGPEHHNDDEMQSLLPLFDQAGVRLVLAGHEHNFQLNEMNGRTYVVSGAGAKLREELPDGLAAAGTVGWCAQAHLLLVDINGDAATLTPVSGLRPDGALHVMSIESPAHQIVYPPFVVQ